jgi:peptidoglycan/xylan/chitin deacetylase (PgdA/CDA1 family)
MITRIVAFGLLLGAVPLLAQQVQPGGRGSQPGLHWTEQQLKDAVAPVRVGRRLTPKTWPNGAKVAVCLRGRHEIGVHGWIHENITALQSEEEERQLMKQAIDYLTKAYGKRPVGYRSPAWAFSPWTMKLIREAGFIYDSSMMGLDEPYELVANGQPTGIVELPVEWILDDAPYLQRTGSLPSPELIFKTYRDEFDVAYREGTMLMLTNHPYITGHRSRISEYEKLVAYMQSKPGVWFATAEQVATYVKQQAARSH